MNDYIIYNGELYHFGVKGMKWGHRKKYYDSNDDLNKLVRARTAYKEAKKAYNKSFDDAYKFSNRHPISKHFGKNKIISNQKWGDVHDKNIAFDEARSDYKSAKKQYRQGKLSTEQKVVIGATVVTTALVAYGAYKVNKNLNAKISNSYLEKAEKCLKAANESYDKNVFDRATRLFYRAEDYTDKYAKGKYSIGEKINYVRKAYRNRRRRR